MKNTLSFTILCLLSVPSWTQTGRYDVVINEIMANPSSTSLPRVKYVELYNRSPHPVELRGWKLADKEKAATIRSSFTLQPDSFVLITSTASAAQLRPVGHVIGVTSFPALRINGDELTLRSPEGKLIHAVAYDRSWYANEVKSDGGWSLEMIDADNPCGSDNWKASTDNSGGTPGRSNAVAGSNPDNIPPRIKRAFADSLRLVLVFDEPLDSVTAADVHRYMIPEAVIIAAEPISPFFNKVALTVEDAIVKSKIYDIHVKEIYDCSGNMMAAVSEKVGRADTPGAMDVIINEILFNPRENGADYIELFNRGQKIINLKDLYITHRTGAGNPGPLRQVSVEDHLLFPGDYLLLTGDAETVRDQYNVADSPGFLEMTDMPFMPNAAGHIILLNSRGETIDELQYEEGWHFPLITNPKGVALERTDPDKPTQDESNWHSAAAPVNYGTPGYQNSQYAAAMADNDEINLFPKVFSPDNDGFDDFLTISYRFPENGNVCNISVFDAQGRLVRKPVRNAVCGMEGSFRWDGLDENTQQLRIGIYVILIELFHPGGKTKQYRKAVTLARRW